MATVGNDELARVSRTSVVGAIEVGFVVASQFVQFVQFEVFGAVVVQVERIMKK